MTKTVAQLIDYLKTKNSELPVAQLYDGFNHDLYIFEDKGTLFFSEAEHTIDYKDANIEFHAKKTNAERG